jgi:hypothetical protein
VIESNKMNSDNESTDSRQIINENKDNKTETIPTKKKKKVL